MTMNYSLTLIGMLFQNDKFFHLLSPYTGYKWIPKKINVIDKTIDVQQIPVSWPKIAQINSEEFLITGGSLPDK